VERTMPQIVFPKSEQPPANITKFLRHRFVPLSIGFDLLLPKPPIRFRLPITLGASVPKTAVHEDGYSLFEKDKIRLS